MGKLFNRAKMTVAGAPGIGIITLGAAVFGAQSFVAAGVLDGDVVSYVIEDGTNWEVGQGTYVALGGFLTRTSIVASSSGGVAINASAASVVFISAQAADFNLLGPGARFYGHVAGRTYYPRDAGQISATNFTPAATTLYAIPFPLPQGVTITALKSLVAVGAAGNATMALYASDQTSHKPTGTPIVTTASVSTSSAAVLVGGISSPINIAAGFLWLAWMADNTGVAMRGISAPSSAFGFIVGSPTDGNILNTAPSIGYSAPFTTFGAWPSLSAGTITEISAGPAMAYAV